MLRLGVGGGLSVSEAPFNLHPLPAFSPPVLPTKAQGSKDGKPKEKVIISDCGEYV